MTLGVRPDLPLTAELPVSKQWSLRVCRFVARQVLRHWWRLRVTGQELVPPSGPVILAANHIGMLDGPAVVAVTRRLTFAMAKHELFAGTGGRILAYLGQIPVYRSRVDRRAIDRSLQVLRADRVLTVFPEGRRTGGEVNDARGGAAYLALVTGATIVPVAVLGTREPGTSDNEVPRRGAPMHVVFGTPLQVPAVPWPRRKALVAEWTETMRRHLAEHVVAAQTLTGLPLPGPPKPRPHRRRS